MSQVEERVGREEARDNGLTEAFFGKSVFTLRGRGNVLKQMRLVRRKVERGLGEKMGDEAFAYAVLARGIAAMEESWGG